MKSGIHILLEKLILKKKRSDVNALKISKHGQHERKTTFSVPTVDWYQYIK